jgi:tripartite-type tricarboxylate transporter receptor subunit TctC
MRLGSLTFAIAAALLPAPLPAQEYPSRPVLFVVPYAAAAGPNHGPAARRRLEQRLGKPFVIDNRPGAGTAIGASFVAKSAPDGHTILLATSTTMAINVSIYSNLAYDPSRTWCRSRCSPTSRSSSWSIRAAGALGGGARGARQRTSGGLAYASNGHGGAGHLYAELMKSMTGIEMTHVPYKGLCARLQRRGCRPRTLMFGDSGTALPLIRAGQLRALGVTTAQRYRRRSRHSAALAGGVAGICRFILADGGGAGGNSQADPAQAQGELRAILAEPDLQKDFTDRGLIPVVSPSPEELQGYVRSEIVRWRKVVEQAGATGSQ